jgi:hypothetical protein
MMADKPPLHLSEYFKSGQLFEMKVPNHRNLENPIVFKLWLQKPNPLQQDEAMKKGRAKQARLKQQYRDESSDDYLSLMEEIAQLGGMDELVDALAQIEAGKLRQQSYNEVLYKPSGVDDEGKDIYLWGEDGSEYLDLLEAIRDRFEEVSKANEALAEEDQHLAIKFEQDEVMQQLQARENEFEAEVEARTQKLIEVEKAKLRGNSVASLRKMMFNRMVETEAGMAWLQEYRVRMLFAACRQADNHNRLYFEDIDKIWELPDFVRTQLLEAYDKLGGELDDVKNSLSLLPSSL